METRSWPVAEEGWLAATLEALRDGGVVAFPTDTGYGLGADPRNAAAVQSLYTAKGRPEGKAIPLLLGAAEQMRQVSNDVPAAAAALAARFWPGPLTLVLPAAAMVLPDVRAGGDTVAVRMPAHLVALRLLAAFGHPLAVTSANRSGRPSPVDAAAVLAQLSGRIPLVVDGGACPGGLASTVLSLAGDRPRLLRAGPVPWEAIAACLGL
ncbi:MAG: threonylcarbamoyl-AMP synthase [Chloroflexi bacterium]|nr:threonylcarbamoyl-AMP synthase [Chloroflexota bacterium]